MENNISTVNGKKIKIILIAVGVILVLAAAFYSANNFSKKNNLYNYKSSSKLSYDETDSMMPQIMDAPVSSRLGMEGAGMGQTEGMNYDASSPVSSSESDSFALSADKRVIKNGNLSIKVDRVSVAQDKISEIAKENGGNIFSSNIYQSKNNIKSGAITVKVPVVNFEKTMGELKKVASLVLRESTSGTDVTEEYQDIETRIKNKQVEEEAYKKILESAQKISDIIEVTQALSRVRGEIEAYQGQLKYLATQTDMSTISVNLSEDQEITVTDSWRPFQIAKDAVNSLVRSAQGFASFLIVLFITFIPMAILYFVLFFIIYVMVKKIYLRFRKKKEANDIR